MAAAATKAVQTASAKMPPLHPQLMRFFARYPPQKYAAVVTEQKIPTLKQRVTMGSKPLSAATLPTSIPGEEDASNPEPIHLQTMTENTETDTSASTKPGVRPSPFLPSKNHATGRWRGAPIGLRRQAQLFKLARACDVEELLPPSIKSTEYKQRRALEKGLAVKGTGEGQNVKGHKWERQIASTMEKRRKAMEEMPEMIRLWKQRGHGRGWKKYPK